MHIIVPTCAAYADAWGPFFTFFQRFWPKCPYPLTLVTDLLPSFDHLATTRPAAFSVIGRDLGWCKNFLQGNRSISPEPEFVLMLQEDFWLSAPPDDTYIARALDIMRADPSIACYRIFPCPGSDQEVGHPDYGEIGLNTEYRVSCQAGIWRTSELVQVLERFTTPAEFELCGTEFFRNERPGSRFVSVRRLAPDLWPIQYICTAIVRGQWLPGALHFAKQQGVPVDTSKRSVMNGPSD